MKNSKLYINKAILHIQDFRTQKSLICYLLSAKQLFSKNPLFRLLKEIIKDKRKCESCLPTDIIGIGRIEFPTDTRDLVS